MGDEISMNSLLSIEVSGGFAAECVYEFHGDLIAKVSQEKRRVRINKWRHEGEKYKKKKQDRAQGDLKKLMAQKSGIGLEQEMERKFE